MVFKMKGNPLLKTDVKTSIKNIKTTIKNIGDKLKKDNTTTSTRGQRAPGSGDIKKEMDWKYGHGDFISREKRRKPGESKFDYDVRMKKEAYKTKLRKNDVKNVVSNCSRIKKLGWKSNVSINEGLELTLNWYITKK